jgi:hypothetical protein
MQKPQGLAKAAAVYAIFAVLATMLAVWSPEAPPFQVRSDARSAEAFRAMEPLDQKPNFASFLCLLVLLGVGWAWRRNGARQPNGGRPAAAVPQFVRYRVIRGRTI